MEMNIETDATSHQRLAENLHSLLLKHKLNMNQLASGIGIPVMTIKRLLSGETSDPRLSTLMLIADYFGISIDSLIDPNDKKFRSLPKRIRPHFVPLLDWNTAERITTIEELDLNQWENWHPISVEGTDNVNQNAFALESRPSMYARFPQGTIFLIDPSITASDGDIVLIRFRDNNELALRELIIDPPQWMLRSIVPGSNNLVYSKECHNIAGIVLLTMFYNRKLS